MSKRAVLFLCTHNAARSQMAEALLRKRAGDRFDSYSAGAEPTQIHPMTIRVLREIGIDMTGQQSKGLKHFLGKLAVHFAVFVCQPQEPKCPQFWPSAINRLQWPFEDPAACVGTEEECLATFRSVRDQIDAQITTWLKQQTAA